MPERPPREERRTDMLRSATPDAETANSKAYQNTPEEDGFEKAARAFVRKSEAAQEASAMAHERAEFAHLLAERWKNP